METFAPPREFVRHARYARDRQTALSRLDRAAIDAPIVDVVEKFVALPHCFTLSCCHGHFVCSPDQDPRSFDPIPPHQAGPIRYRIAYLALCIEDSPRGRALRESLARVPAIDPAAVQFGSPTWFSRRWPRFNCYAIQVEPERFRFRDEALLDRGEALDIQRTRDRFFDELRTLLAREGELPRVR
jgi:hypothetical protein